MARTPELVAGVVGRPHGLDGSFHVLQAHAELLQAGMRVTVAGGEAEVVRLAGTQARPILRLAGHSDRDAADALRGERLLVTGADAPQLGPDEFYPEQLEGCHVHDGERDVGVVRDVLALPSCEALQVELPGGAELLVPLVRDAIRGVHVAERRIEIDLGFLNAD